LRDNKIMLVDPLPIHRELRCAARVVYRGLNLSAASQPGPYTKTPPTSLHLALAS